MFNSALFTLSCAALASFAAATGATHRIGGAPAKNTHAPPTVAPQPTVSGLTFAMQTPGPIFVHMIDPTDYMVTDNKYQSVDIKSGAPSAPDSTTGQNLTAWDEWFAFDVTNQFISDQSPAYHSLNWTNLWNDEFRLYSFNFTKNVDTDVEAQLNITLGRRGYDAQMNITVATDPQGLFTNAFITVGSDVRNATCFDVTQSFAPDDVQVTWVAPPTEPDQGPVCPQTPSTTP